MVMKKSPVQTKSHSHPAENADALQNVPVILSSAIVTLCCFAPTAFAAPTGGNVVAGEGSIQQSSSSTVINQASQSLAINWDTFNVGADESVRFNQPSSSSVVLNRIVSQTPSEIFGRLDANGRVFLVNPNGILFGQSAIINVGSLLASTLDIDPQQFMQGDYTFSAAQGQTPGIVVNQGLIQASTGGSVSLVGGAVSNEGAIVAKLGQVNLAAGRKAVMDFDGDGLIRFEVSDNIVNNTHALSSAVNNSGQINADGGEVLMKGSVAADVFSQAVNNDGVIKAARIENKGGVIRLVGNNSPVVNSGTLDVSGQDASSTGGTVEVLGDKVALNEGSTINASGDAGGGTVLIGGDTHGANPDIQNATQTSVSNNTTINADAKVNGDGGKVVVWSDGSTEFYGDISVRGGAEGGNGGFVEISGKQHLTVPLSQVTIDRRAPAGAAGELLLDPGTVIICDDADTVNCGTQTGPNTFDDASIASQLALGDVTITTTSNAIPLVGGTPTNVTTANGAAEDINFVDSTINISWTTGSNFTLIAGHDINYTGTINWSAKANVTMTAGNNITMTTGTISAGHGLSKLLLNFGNTLDLGSVDLSGMPTAAVTATGTGTSSGIQGQDIDTIWTVTGTNTGNLVNANGTVNYSGVNSLAGGATGSDTLDLSGLSGPISVNLETGTATDAGSFSGFDVFKGNNTNSTLTGANTASTFSVSSTNSGTVGGVTFSNFNILTGGTGNDIFDISGDVTGAVNGGGGNDTFNFISGTVAAANGGADDDSFVFKGGTVSGTVDGGTHTTTDTIDLSNRTGTQSVNVQTSVATETAGSISFTNINKLVGNNTDATLVGSTIGVSAQNSGTADGVNFSGFNNISGTDSADSITVNANVTGNVDAGLGNDSITLGSSGSVTGTLTGGGGTDTLTGPNTDNNWTIATTANSGILNTTQPFSSMENLSGGSGIDTFTFGADVTGAIHGGGNNDIFNINTALSGTVYGDAGNDTFNINVSATSSVDGGADNDTFIFADAGKLTGTVTGGTGSDTIDYSGKTTAINVNLQDKSSTDINGGSASGFSSIETILGGSASNTVTGGDVANTWSITGTDIFSVDNGVENVAFNNFKTLNAGTGGDTFQFNGGSISGSIKGSTGFDSLDFSAAGTTVAVNLETSSVSLINSGASNGFTGIDKVVGNGTTDSLVGANSGNTWNITGTNAGNIQGGMTFTNMSHLVAGSGGDTFKFGGSGIISNGSITGGAGVDKFDFSTSGSSVTVNLANNSSTLINSGGTSGFSSIEDFTGGGGDDALVGGNTSNTWNITGIDTGDVGGVTFKGMNLQAGSAGDTFKFTSGSTSLNGSITGGAGSDTIDFSGISTNVSVNLANSSASHIKGGAAGGFSAIDKMIGGSGSNTVTGANSGSNIWSITGADAVTVSSIDFTGFGSLIAGTGGDTFKFGSAASLSGSITGGTGSDTLDFSNTSSAVTVDLANHAATPIANGFSSIEAVIGGGGDDTLVGGNSANTWSLIGADSGNVGGVSFNSMSNLTAGSGGDTFLFGSGSSVSGTVTGGAGSDTLNFANAGSGVTTVNLSDNSTALIKSGSSGGFSGIEKVVGKTGDEIIAPNAANTWLIAADNTGSVAGMSFSGFTTLTGGGLDDTLTVDFSGTSSRGFNFDGGAGNNSVILTGGNATETGSYTPLTANSASINYVDGVNTETLALNQVGSITDNRTAATLTVNGSSSNDTISLSTGAVGVSSLLGITYANKTNLTVNGGAGTDTVDVTGAVSLPSVLSIEAENITDTSGAIVSADTLAINGAASLGTSTNPFMTNIGNLQLTGIATNDYAYINDASALNLKASSIGGNLVLTTAGAVTQSGAMSVAGSTTITAGSNAISLGNGGNDFSGAVSLTNTGANAITLNDANNLTIGAISSGGNVTVSNQSGDINLGTITTGGNVGVTTQSGDVNLGKIDTSRDVTLTVNGGDLLGDNSTQINPNIKAANLDIRAPDGAIGKLTNQIAVNVTTSTKLFSLVPTAYLTGPTGTLTSGSNIVVSTSDIQGTASRGQNLVAGNIYFIDPALFSQEFSLFNITDDGIRLPPDQVEDQ